MVNIPVKISQPLSKNTIHTLNTKISGALTKETVLSLNRQRHTMESNSGTEICRNPLHQSPGPARQNVQEYPTDSHPATRTIPVRLKPVKKGQKVPLTAEGQKISEIEVCFGWNISDARCDADASVFMVDDSGKALGDEWFVFYGQTISPDKSIVLFEDSTKKDRQIFKINLDKLQCAVKKIVFVLTINEALEKDLNFSMLGDVYLRILNTEGKELVSFKLEEYFQNVTSMTIGELYLYNGRWKFNPVGNGVHQDLAGQCAVYGVQVG